MAVDYNRQYIGARYVPTFFNNPDGSWDWVEGFQYEPLTIVKYGTSTFTSKKLVPSTVGTPNTAPEYWANTGEYNGAILALQEEINNINLKESIKDLILIGDSYGVSSVVGNNSWPVQLQNYYANKGIKSYISCHSSRGFVPNNIVAESFLDNLKEFDSLTSDQKNKVKKIIVCGGANDSNQTTINILQNIDIFVQYAKSIYPNATVYIGMIAYATNPTNMFVNSLIAYKSCTLYGAIYLSGIENSCRLTMLQEDGLHPNNAGNSEIANGIINILEVGSYSPYRINTDITITPSGICTAINNLGIIREIQSAENDRIEVLSSTEQNLLSFVVEPTNIINKSPLEVGTVSGNLCACGNVAHGNGYVQRAYLRNVSGVIPDSDMMVSLYLALNNKLYIAPLGRSDGNNFFIPFNNVTMISLSDAIIRDGNSYLQY